MINCHSFWVVFFTSIHNSVYSTDGILRPWQFEAIYPTSLSSLLLADISDFYYYFPCAEAVCRFFIRICGTFFDRFIPFIGSDIFVLGL
jgi:hypothetical protein